MPHDSANPVSDSAVTSPQRLRGVDWVWLGLAIGIPLAGLLMQAVGTENVSLGGSILPTVCGSRAWLGIDCPLCGVTRSVIHLMHGNYSASWEAHRLGWLIFGAIIIQAPYRLLIPWQTRASGKFCRRLEVGFWITIGLLLIVNRIAP